MLLFKFRKRCPLDLCKRNVRKRPPLYKCLLKTCLSRYIYASGCKKTFNSICLSVSDIRIADITVYNKESIRSAFLLRKSNMKVQLTEKGIKKFVLLLHFKTCLKDL